MIYNVLIAEDNFINQKLMEKLISSKGWLCTIVGDGSEVLKELKNNSFHIVLMDISMPDMDGYKATQLIRKFNKNIPIIGVTANALEGFREKCIESGMNDFLTKPFHKEELFQLMGKYLPIE